MEPMFAPVETENPVQSLALQTWPELEDVFDRLRPDFERRLATGTVTHPGDLLLALACHRRLAVGLTLFEGRVIPAVRASVRRVEGAEVDEVLQIFRERLWLGGKLSSYHGRGSFEGWCRAVAVRIALEGRSGSSVGSLEESLPLHERSVELAYLLNAHRSQFRAAFRAAFGTLSTRDRALLRLSTVEGVSLESIGRQYQVNKSTVSRWLAAAREAVLSQVRAELSQTVTRDPRELDSLLTQLGSQLSISLSVLERSDALP